MNRSSAEATGGNGHGKDEEAREALTTINALSGRYRNPPLPTEPTNPRSSTMTST